MSFVESHQNGNLGIQNDPIVNLPTSRGGTWAVSAMKSQGHQGRETTIKFEWGQRSLPSAVTNRVDSPVCERGILWWASWGWDLAIWGDIHIDCHLMSHCDKRKKQSGNGEEIKEPLSCQNRHFARGRASNCEVMSRKQWIVDAVRSRLLTLCYNCLSPLHACKYTLPNYVRQLSHSDWPFNWASSSVLCCRASTPSCSSQVNMLFGHVTMGFKSESQLIEQSRQIGKSPILSNPRFGPILNTLPRGDNICLLSFAVIPKVFKSPLTVSMAPHPMLALFTSLALRLVRGETVYMPCKGKLALAARQQLGGNCPSLHYPAWLESHTSGPFSQCLAVISCPKRSTAVILLMAIMVISWRCVYIYIIKSNMVRPTHENGDQWSEGPSPVSVGILHVAPCQTAKRVLGAWKLGETCPKDLKANRWAAGELRSMTLGIKFQHCQHEWSVKEPWWNKTTRGHWQVNGFGPKSPSWWNLKTCPCVLHKQRGRPRLLRFTRQKVESMSISWTNKSNPCPCLVLEAPGKAEQHMLERSVRSHALPCRPGGKTGFVSDCSTHFCLFAFSKAWDHFLSASMSLSLRLASAAGAGRSPWTISGSWQLASNDKPAPILRLMPQLQ